MNTFLITFSYTGRKTVVIFPTPTFLPFVSGLLPDEARFYTIECFPDAIAALLIATFVHWSRMGGRAASVEVSRQCVALLLS